MHFDHIGGNTKIVNGKLEPVFPNAVYWMQKENWNLANSTNERDNGSFLKDDWSILQENEMITMSNRSLEFYDKNFKKDMVFEKIYNLL